MHDRAKNFFSFLSDAYLKYFPVEVGSEEEPKKDTISEYIRDLANEKAKFREFQFGYLAVICNHEKIRPKIEIVKELYQNEDQMNMVIQNIRNVCNRVKVATERVESIPDQELKEFISKFSRYINLFTLMYFNKK